MELTQAETELWTLWKRATETLRAGVAADIDAATGLSDPDFGVVTRMVELGRGRLRQSELAASMGWHRSRLSHHLTRMEERGLVRREGVHGGVDVVVTAQGRAAARRARPVHAQAVRAHLVDPLSAAERRQLRTILGRLTQVSGEAGR